MLVRTCDLNELTLKLCERESAYLNPSVISKSQVLDLLTKLYKNKHGSLPPSSIIVAQDSGRGSESDSPTQAAAAAPAKYGESAPEPTQKQQQ